MNTLAHLEPEYASLQAFVDFLRGDGRLWPTPEEFDELSFRHQRTKLAIRNELVSEGFEPPRARPKLKRTRGFTANPHDRWEVVPTYSTRSNGQVESFAGQPESRLKSQHIISSHRGVTNK